MRLYGRHHGRARDATASLVARLIRPALVCHMSLSLSHLGELGA